MEGEGSRHDEYIIAMGLSTPLGLQNIMMFIPCGPYGSRASSLVDGWYWAKRLKGHSLALFVLGVTNCLGLEMSFVQEGCRGEWIEVARTPME